MQGLTKIENENNKQENDENNQLTDMQRLQPKT